MEKLVVKFSLSAKEMFVINLLASIRTVFLIFLVGVLLAGTALIMYAAQSLIKLLDMGEVTLSLTKMSIYVIVAAFVYAIGILIYASIRTLIYTKKDRKALDERLISIEEESAVVLYSDDTKEKVVWGNCKNHYENKRYLILRDEKNIKNLILKKSAFSSEEIDWLKKNLKTQQILEYRRKIEAKRGR